MCQCWLSVHVWSSLCQLFYLELNLLYDSVMRPISIMSPSATLEWPGFIERRTIQVDKQSFLYKLTDSTVFSIICSHQDAWRLNPSYCLSDLTQSHLGAFHLQLFTLLNSDSFYCNGSSLYKNREGLAVAVNCSSLLHLTVSQFDQPNLHVFTTSFC
jgi:hypothetical protein